MTAYVPSFDTALSSDLWSTADPAAAMRATLRLPHLMRFQGARAALFTGAVLLASSPEARESAMAGLERAMVGFAEIYDLLVQWDRKARLHPDARAILAEVIPADPATMQAVSAFGDLPRKVLGLLGRGETPPADMFDEVMHSAYSVFHPAMIDLETRMQATGGAARKRLDASASAARARAMDARARIEGIARTVRLISLNARVEAARAGEAGRAFGVIAGEIKSLSEETEAVSAELGASVDEMMESFRAF